MKVQPFSRHGITLVEVIASIALLSTLLVGMLIAHQRNLKQIRVSRQLDQAAILADDLLANWFLEDVSIQAGQTGGFESTDEFFWTVRDVGRSLDNPRWEAKVVALCIFSTDSQWPSPLLSIELLVADEVQSNETGLPAP